MNLKKIHDYCFLSDHQITSAIKVKVIFKHKQQQEKRNITGKNCLVWCTLRRNPRRCWNPKRTSFSTISFAFSTLYFFFSTYVNGYMSTISYNIRQGRYLQPGIYQQRREVGQKCLFQERLFF